MINYEIKRFKDSKLSSEELKKFENPRNPILVKYLQNNAIKDDIENTNAVFIVIDTETNEIAFYYALKTCSIADFTDEIKFERLKEEIERQEKAKQKGNQIKNKIMLPDMIPCIELSIFCKNYNYSKFDVFTNIGVSFGEFIFHKQIIPHVKHIQQFTGFSHLCLYAADSTEEKTLVKYYKNKLGFNSLNNNLIIPIQPSFDFKCTFLYMPINS